MGFGKRRAAVGAVISVCGVMAPVSFASAQTRDRDLGCDVFRAFGAGSEIGVFRARIDRRRSIESRARANWRCWIFESSATGKKRRCG